MKKTIIIGGFVNLRYIVWLFGAKCYDFFMKSIILIVLLLCIPLSHAEEREIPVRVSLVKNSPISEELPLTGMITARRVSSLSPRVDGHVTQVLVNEGDYVKKGDILIELDKVLAEYDVQSAAAAVQEAKAHLQESIRQRDELGKLIKNQYLAKTSYETAVSEVKIKDAIVKRLKAAYQRNMELAGQHHIKAPFDGVISEKMVESGQWIKVGNPVLELVDVDNLRVEVSVPQYYFSDIQLKTPVTIYTDALPGKPIQAGITHIIPVADATAHAFPVHIGIDNKERQFTPGMSAKAIFQLASNQENPSSLLVPRDAIVKKSNHPDSVWVVEDKQGALRVFPVTVTTGKIFKDQVEILGNELKPGQQIVIRGNEILKPGQKVRRVP